jgi:hypothetical protein
LTNRIQYEAASEHILYLVLLPTQGSGEFSPFQGFSTNLYAALDAIRYICIQLPPTIGDLFRTRDEAIRYRSIGLAGHAIVPIEQSSLPTGEEGLPLTCFVSNSESQEQVEALLAKTKISSWLHLTTDHNCISIPRLWDFSRADFAAWTRTMAEAAFAKGRPASEITELNWRTFIPWPEERLGLPTRSHNVTAPTETVLRSFNFALSAADKPLAGNSDEEFAAALSTASNELERVRHEAGADRHIVPGSPMIIIAVPPVYRRLTPDFIRKDAPTAVKKAFRNVLRQRQYTAMRGNAEDIKSIIEDQTARAMLHARAMELAIYTEALSVAACSLAVPVLRCPPQVDRVRELLFRLAGMSRAGAPNPQRRSKLAKNIGDSLRAAIPKELVQRIEHHRYDGIKLIGDTPLELMTVDELPLSLRATVSRMPTLPGNLLLRHGATRVPLMLVPEDLKRVLIVRAFEQHDPLRNLVVEAIRIVNNGSRRKVELQVVDVGSKEQFVDAFNNFDGPLAVFDGHGAQDRTGPQGTLKVGSIRLNPFELYGKIKIPPLLLLSACETHPLEGIESSVASGFLMLGARSVLGTMVPIDGRNAAVLIARFMLRFAEFLPSLTTMMPWSQVIGGMLRMSYVTDVLRTLQKQFPLSLDDYTKIHKAANIAIISFQPDWFEELLKSVAAAVSTPEDKVREIWLRTCYFTDTLHYVHLGQPEHIFVVPRDSASQSEGKIPVASQQQVPPLHRSSLCDDLFRSG